MAIFDAAYSTQDPALYNYYNRQGFFGGKTDTQAAQEMQQALARGNQVTPQQAAQQTQQRAQSQSIGLANTARGGRGNSAMMRSAMLQSPQSQQAGQQAAYAQQQANFQQAGQAQQTEAARRAAIEGQTLADYKLDNADALQQQRSQINAANAVAGIESLAVSAAASDERTKRVLSGAKGKPSIVIMIGHDDDDDEEEEGEGSADEHALDAMRQLEPADFEYKPEFQGAPGAGYGKYTGIMAQDLEKTPAGRGAVVEDSPDGIKRVDPGKLSTLNSAAISALTKKVDRMGARK